MFWIYALIFAAVMAAGVYAVETYRSAIASSVVSKAEAASQTARAQRAITEKENLQQLFDTSETIGQKRAQELRTLQSKVGSQNDAIENLKRNKPAVLACESCPVDPDIRRMRRDAFTAAVTTGTVLHPEVGVAGNAGPAIPGRNLRTDSPGSGQPTSGADSVQSREGIGTPITEPAKPTTIFDRIKRMMGN